MQQYVLVLKTLLVASVGGYIGYKLKIPAGAMLGSMIAVAAASLLKVDLGSLPHTRSCWPRLCSAPFLGSG